MAGFPGPELVADPVYAWRVEQLLEAEVPYVLALELAYAEVDSHAVLDLLARGCPPELAARILLPL